MAYTLNEEIKNALKTKDRRTKKAVEVIIGGKILKKYRLVRKVSSELGLNVCRNRMAEVKDKILKQVKRKRSLKEHGLYQEMIVNFLERCDNSTVHPNKPEVKIVDGTMNAKRILNDYLDSLYNKFMLESPNAKVSRSTFFRCRPTYILPVSFSARRTCLCLKHQNMTLMLNVLQLTQTRGSSETKNADALFRNHSDEQVLTMMDSLEEGNVKYSTWKRVDIGDGKKKMNLVMVDITKEEFKLIFIDTMHKFREHIRLVSNQYTEIRKLKENLPCGHVVAQMDFSENYTCTSMEEVQSAYWNQSMVAIHPVVAYFKKEEKNQLVLKTQIICLYLGRTKSYSICSLRIYQKSNSNATKNGSHDELCTVCYR